MQFFENIVLKNPWRQILLEKTWDIFTFLSARVPSPIHFCLLRGATLRISCGASPTRPCAWLLKRLLTARRQEPFVWDTGPRRPSRPKTPPSLYQTLSTSLQDTTQILLNPKGHRNQGEITPSKKKLPPCIQHKIPQTEWEKLNGRATKITPHFFLRAPVRWKISITYDRYTLCCSRSNSTGGRLRFCIGK